MKIIEKRKASGGIRRIFAPSPEEKGEYQALLETISPPLGRPLSSAHGFLGGKSIVTNALPHVGDWECTVSMDLSDFFDSVRPAQLRGKVPAAVAQSCFWDSEGNVDPDNGAPRQGLPTSPMIANLAAIPLDEAIRKMLAKIGCRSVYTRYADDLTISLSDASIADELIGKVRQIVQRCGFRLNPRKTRVQRATAGRREICGVMVDAQGIHISRRMRRKIRASHHNLVEAQKSGLPGRELRKMESRTLGLMEFATLKPPSGKTKAERLAEHATAQREADASLIRSKFGLDEVTRDSGESCSPDRRIAADCWITDDPAQMYGMSAYTSGWTSCMSITRSSHSYKAGVVFWAALPGVSLAYQGSKDVRIIGGVTRPAMRARVLVYHLRDGRKCWGHLYGGHGHYMPGLNDDHPLIVALRNAGHIPASECRGELVVGHVPQPCPLPYFDIGKIETVTLAESRRSAYRVRL